MLDLIVVSTPRSAWITDGLIPSSISAIYNNLQGDSFFIKARMVTDDKIGAPVRSTSFRAVLTSLNDEKFITSCSDPGQTAFGAL